MPTFFVGSEAIVPPTVRITGPLLRHLRQSLRLQPGETLSVTSEAGLRYRIEITEITEQALTGRILDTSSAPPPTGPSIILGQALLKGEKMDWVIQKATELGAAGIAPIVATHAVVKPRAERIDHQLTRWQRIALEAAQQSERWSIPAVDAPATIKELAARYAAASTKLLLAERSRGVSLAGVGPPLYAQDMVLLVIGPEGGWEEEELRLAQEQGFALVTLGPRILRAETAAIAAISIVQSRFGQLG
jgi:16S rRNA (uracil1498-N3)-methyltransferase